ncbi:MAG: phosphoglycerate dehydrogenase [Planctomycetota bacterium]
MAEEKIVFIADKISEDALRILRDAGIAFDYRPGLPPEEKKAAVSRARALIVRSDTKATKEFLDSATALELIVRAGVGVDNIDVDAATRRGIVVQNVPEGNVRSAAEHTIALLLALARNVPQGTMTMKEGKWERSKLMGVEVLGKALGIVGLGKIGRHVAQMANGLGFRVLAHDPFVAPRLAQELNVELVPDLKDLVARVDFLTVHVPLSPATKKLVNAELLERAKPGLRLVNCARGGVVDEAALVKALDENRVAAAAVDVFENEPPGLTPLVAHPRVISTPHLGASTREAQENVAIAAAHQVVDYFLLKKLHSPVNAIVLDPELRERMAPYRELALRLGRLQAQLLEGNPVRVAIKYYGEIFDERIQRYITNSVLEGFLGSRSEQPVNVINARALAKEQGLTVEERSEGKSRYFVAMVRVEVEDNAGKREVGGTIRGRSGLRLVSLDAYQFDAVLEGTMLITANKDKPGMIGVIGNALAAGNVNISNMSLGRDRTGGTALSLLNVDDPVPEEVLRDLRAHEGILWSRVVEIDPRA